MNQFLSSRFLVIVLTFLLLFSLSSAESNSTNSSSTSISTSTSTSSTSNEKTGHACTDDGDCDNSGTCLKADNSTTSIIEFNICECPTGYSGDHCQLACPCKNDGTCLSWNGNNATCACKTGFTGDTCEISVVLCPDNAVECMNGGVCVMADASTATYGCICPAGYSGYNCEYDPSLGSSSKNIFTEIQDIELRVAKRMSSHAIFGIIIASCFGVVLCIYAYRAFKRRTRNRREWDMIRKNTDMAFDPANVSRHDVDML